MRDALARPLHRRRDLQRPPRGVGRVRPTPYARNGPLGAMRILLVSQMYPGPAIPTSARSSRSRSVRSASVGTRSTWRCSTGAAAASAGFSSCGGRSARRLGPTSSGRTSSFPPGSVASERRRPARRHGAWPRRPQHRRDPGRRHAHAPRRRARLDRDRRLRLPAPRARGEAARGAREDRGGRLGRRPRPLRRCRSRRASWSIRRSSASAR